MRSTDRYRRGRLLLLAAMLTLISVTTIVFSLSHGTHADLPSSSGIKTTSYFPSKLSDLLHEFQVQKTKNSAVQEEFKYPVKLSPEGKPRATFYMMLTQVRDMAGAFKSVRSIENRFNKNHHYDWVFAYQGTIPEDITASLERYCSGRVHFAVIPEDDEYYAVTNITNLDTTNLSKSKLRLIPYGESVTFRMRNRFQSWGFQNLNEMKQFDYYCNVEVDTELECDMDHDFFQFMYDNDMLYGFVHAPPEPVGTTKMFWKTVVDLLEGPKITINPSGLLQFLVDDKGGYSKCTFGSNLEVGSLGFFRSREYYDIFEHMDKAEGFFIDRWLDANIHTLAVTVLLPQTKIFWMENTGFIDGDSRSVCPLDREKRINNKCSCDPSKDYSWGRNSCLRYFFQINDMVLPAGVPDIKPFKPRYKKMYSKKAEDKRNPTLKRLNYMSEEEIDQLLSGS